MVTQIVKVQSTVFYFYFKRIILAFHFPATAHDSMPMDLVGSSWINVTMDY